MVKWSSMKAINNDGKNKTNTRIKALYIITMEIIFFG